MNTSGCEHAGGDAITCDSVARAPPHIQLPRCFATLLYKDSNVTWQRRAFEEDEAMIRLWAQRLLNVTALPVFVMHYGVNASAILDSVDVNRRLHYVSVSAVLGAYWSQQPWYRHVHTKLHAWNLPCETVAFMDYDGVILRNLDSVFDTCGVSALCAVQDVVTPKKKGQRLPNAGLLVLRPDRTTHSCLVDAATRDGRCGLQRVLAEQGFLNYHFQRWKGLPEAYNVRTRRIVCAPFVRTVCRYPIALRAHPTPHRSCTVATVCE